MTTDSVTLPEFQAGLAALISQCEANGPTMAAHLMYGAIALADSWSLSSFQRLASLAECEGILRICFAAVRADVTGIASPPKGGIQA